jgi:putative oxidoreductase
LFGWFGGPGLEATGQFFAIGFQPGRRHALMAGLAETGGGLFLALGLLTPVAAALAFSVMLVAAVTVHIKKGFFAQNGGYEYTLVLGIAALTIVFTGPGSLSLDALLGYSVSGALWGLAASFVGLHGGTIQLARRRPAPQANRRRIMLSFPTDSCSRPLSQGDCMNLMKRSLGLLTLSASVLFLNGTNPRGAVHAQTAAHSSPTDVGRTDRRREVGKNH